MINLKDLASYILVEGILDDIDDNLTSGDNAMYDDLLTKWAANGKNTSKAWWRKTKKGYVIKGNYIINDLEDVYVGPMIKQVMGNLVICDSKLENLEGMFTPDCEITGTLTIEDNSELISLKGCPVKVGSLTISNNKKLKNIDLSPVVMNNAYVSSNGKKFKKEDLEKTMQVAKHIFCSIDDEKQVLVESELLMEAFRAPQLKLVVDAIKKAGKTKDSDMKAKINHIKDIKWDQIKASDITEYDAKDHEASKMCRKVLTDHDGIIVLLNKAGEVIYIITGKSWVLCFNKYTDYRPLNKYSFGYGYTHQTRDILEIVTKYADTVWIIDTTETNDGTISGKEGRLSTFKQKQERANSKRDAVAYQRQTEKEYTTAEIEASNGKLVRYNNDILRENYKRYKRMLSEIRAKRELEANNRFEGINDRIDKCFNRYMKLVRAIAMNSSKYEKLKYEIGALHTNLGQTNSYSSNSGSLMSLLSEYLKILTEKERYIGDNRNEFDKMYYDPKTFTKKLSNLENAMEARLKIIEDYLKQLEAIK